MKKREAGPQSDRMPALHSSPHPTKDPRLADIDWNPQEELMAGNPYPDVRPNYDAEMWGAEVWGADPSVGGGRQHHRQGRSPWTHASQFDTGSRSRQPREHPHPQGGRHRPNPWTGRQRAVSFEGRIPVHTSHRRAHHPEDEEEDFDEEEFEYEPYDEDEMYGGVPFLPPHMHRRAWDSSDGESEEEEEEEDLDEEELDEEEDDYEAEVRANMREQGHGMMRGRERSHHRARRGPPPLQSRSSSVPRLTRGVIPGHDGPPRFIQGHGQVRARGGPPRGRGMSIHRGRGRASFARVPSGSSYSGDGWGGFATPRGSATPGAMLRRSSSTAGSIRKAVRWLTNSNGTLTTLHPLLRTSSLLRSSKLMWDIRRPPVPLREGAPIGIGLAGFAEPATSPPVAFMRLVVPIPGLNDAHWNVDVWPAGSPYSPLPAALASPYSFVAASPSGFARALPMSPFASSFVGQGPPGPIVRCADVLYALFTMLFRRATESDYWALDERQRERVSRAFYVRCRAAAAAAAGGGGHRGEEAAWREQGDVAMDMEVNSGVRRIDFMDRKTRWEGLEAGDMDEWIVRLGRAS